MVCKVYKENKTSFKLVSRTAQCRRKEGNTNENRWWMLKAPPLIPWTYISRYSKIGPKGGVNMFENIFEKVLK